MIQINSSDNRYPDCLQMECKAKLVEPTISGRMGRTSLKFFLIFLFGEHELNSNNMGQELNQILEEANFQLNFLKFGLRGGNLKLKLDGCKVSSLEDAYNPQLIEPSVEVEQSNETSAEFKPGLEIRSDGGKITLFPGIGYKIVERNRQVRHQVLLKNFSPTNLVWVFKAQIEPFLQGGFNIEDREFALIEVTRPSCELTATFKISAKDIFLTGGEVFWNLPGSRIGLNFQNINEHNKLAIIETMFVHRIVLPILIQQNPYLSQQQLNYVS